MLRRKPTRIDLKIDDISEEWTATRRDRKSGDGTQSADGPTHVVHKSRKDIVHERIGYEPRTAQHASSRDARLH